MHKWQYIFTSVVILSLAIVASAYAPAFSQSKSGSYMIAAERGNVIWRVNVKDGSVSFCQRDGAISSNPSYIAKLKPACSGATAPASH